MTTNVLPHIKDSAIVVAGLQVVSETRSESDPYVLLIPYGTDGFHLDIRNDGLRRSRSPLWNTMLTTDAARRP